MQRWYLVHTKPSGEASARANLERQRYEVYFPQVVQSVRHGARWREQIAPLFPRYVFVRIDEGQQSLRPVHSTIGVTSVVRFGAQYTIVPDRVIRDLRSRMDGETGLHRLQPREQMPRGTPVRITMGPFDGLQGVFEREAGEERVVVLLSLLGQDAKVCVPSGYVRQARCA